MVRWRRPALALSLTIMVTVCLPSAHGELLISGRDTTATPGERIGIPLEIRSTRPLTAPRTLQLQIRTRASVLLPEGAYRWVGSRDILRYVTIRLDAGPARTEQVWIPYTCVLGDSAQIGIRIVGAIVHDSGSRDTTNVRVVQSGTLSVAGVCTAGGRPRLFHPWVARTAMPDPTSVSQGVWDLQGRYLGSSIEEVCAVRGVEALYVQRLPSGGLVVGP